LFYVLFVIRAMTPLCDIGIPVGESLVVSAENKPLIAIATGTVTTITDSTVTIVIDRWMVIFSKCLWFCIYCFFCYVLLPYFSVLFAILIINDMDVSAN